MDGSVLSREAKVVAIPEAFSWLSGHNFNSVHVETNSLQVVQNLNSIRGNSSFHLVLGTLKT